MLCIIRMKILFALLFSLLFIVHNSAFSQKTDAHFQNEFYSLLSLDTSKTNTHTSQSLITRSERAYLMHYKIFLNHIIYNRTTSDYPALFTNITDSLFKYANTEKRTWAFLSEINLQKGILEYNSNHQSNAIYSFIKAYRYWQKSKSYHPKLKHNQKLKGIFNLLMSNMPQPYKKFARWIGFAGDSKMGFIALKSYLSTNTTNIGSHQEAILYMAFSYLKFESKNSDIENFIKEYTNENLLPITQFTLARCSFKIRKPELCQHYFTDSLTNKFAPLLYLKGKYEVLSMNNNGANTLLNYISLNKSSIFIADAHRYISWQYLLNGYNGYYLEHQNFISKLNNYPTWEDKQAKYESTLKYIPNTTLLQARLLFDSGTYQTAIDSLIAQQENIKTKEQKIEFQYRLGRCYQLLNDNNKAIFHYTETVKLGELSKRYFAPYAALFNAELHIKDNPVTAKFHIKEAQRLNNGEHKNSIQRKVELLNELLK